MSIPKADQRSATQIKAEAIVAASLAAGRARHGEVTPEPTRFLRPPMVTAPAMVWSERTPGRR